MVPAQDVVRLMPLQSLDLVPATVVALVLVAFAAALVLVALRRRDAD